MNKEENTNQQVIDFINENLETNNADIDRSHIIERYDKAKRKTEDLL